MHVSNWKSTESRKAVSSLSSGGSKKDQAQLKMQIMPNIEERFREMVERTKNDSEPLSKQLSTEKYLPDKTSETENVNSMEFDVTQWENTLWAENKSAKFCTNNFL
ncbi:unnamed protein product [Thelazia callipaeda]|uniref:RPAP1_N domain-containing protein n=1 Tax=Thelazia callipaeda TaxID=103827 RepID=A0A0N5D708_THECL|nr:unnamed protein product [Thelazia callipaeda]